jgi:hypothetical protein
MSAVKRVEFVSDRMSSILPRGRWCNMIVLNVDAPTEVKIDDMTDSFYEELEHVFGKLPNYHMKTRHLQTNSWEYEKLVMIMELQ